MYHWMKARPPSGWRRSLKSKPLDSRRGLECSSLCAVGQVITLLFKIDVLSRRHLPCGLVVMYGVELQHGPEPPETKANCMNAKEDVTTTECWRGQRLQKRWTSSDERSGSKPMNRLQLSEIVSVLFVFHCWETLRTTSGIHFYVRSLALRRHC